jgi:CheY-like chemotaxis protein
MVICVIDDLMASINISSLAKGIGGIDVYFERAPEKVLGSIRDKSPSLVVFDLNSRKMNPLAAIAALKADPDLKHIRTIGFVSHVDSATIGAARQAGIDQVLARSAFFSQLRQILTAA